jgi:uncharacterized Zn finger protein (UPF0148 family)
MIIMPGETSEVFTVTAPAMSAEFLAEYRRKNLAASGEKCLRCGLALNVDDGETSCPPNGELCIYGQMMEAGKRDRL